LKKLKIILKWLFKIINIRHFYGLNYLYMDFHLILFV
jgi:hypothetical protein